MRVLGIDFGLRKVGLAVSDGKLAEPLMVIKYSSLMELVGRIKQVTEREKVEKVIVGISEGEMARKAYEFGENLKKFVEVGYQNEILTTKDAIELSITAGIKREKRKKLEDAFAAAVMLQGYLDR